MMSAAILLPAQSASAASFVTISGAGSTWAENAFSTWTTDAAALGMTVNYSPVGSVSGRQDFSDGAADWAVSEVPYGVVDGSISDPPPTRGFTYMPATAGGVALIYNLSIGGTEVTNLRLSGAVIAGIFTNQITNWDAPQIAADNPGLSLPNEQIVPVVRTDGTGATWPFTQWLSATQASSWTAYCTVVGRNPCTPTSAYPVAPNSSMIGESGDLGVAGYVKQAVGTIGYTEYSYAQQTGFPVAKVLNAAGYYTAPTPDNIGVSLLSAQVNTDNSENLSPVYADADPRTYELSYYSYMIVPTDLTTPMTTAKGDTLGAFGSYLLCQGQQLANPLGYAALPADLVQDGFTQLLKIPGNQVGTVIATDLQNCSNPTLSNGADILASTAPMPASCDQQGSTQCIATTTALTASPNPVIAGEVATLTATVAAGDGSTPAGTVQFGVGSSDIGAPATVNAAGVATTTVTFAAVGTESLSAVFVPAAGASYAVSEATLSLVVSVGTAGAIPVGVTVPATGSLTVTVSSSAISLGVPGTTPPLTATGTLNTVTVTDTRNTAPGWSVSAQDTAFASPAGSTAIPGDDLGWAPSGTVAGGATLGPAVLPGASPGLADAAQLLASAAPGLGVGTDTLSAALTLFIPATVAPGPYSSTLTITYLLTGP